MACIFIIEELGIFCKEKYAIDKVQTPSDKLRKQLLGGFLMILQAAKQIVNGCLESQNTNDSENFAIRKTNI